jgi:steroid 5-alpha reductase family enzyme
MTILQLSLAALASSLALSLVVWIVSVARHNVALADRAWSVLIMASAVVFVVGQPLVNDRVAVMLLLGTVWALRLSLFITWRSWGKPEERRYAQMRQRNQPHFEWKSLVLVLYCRPCWLGWWRCPSWLQRSARAQPTTGQH